MFAFHSELLLPVSLEHLVGVGFTNQPYWLARPCLTNQYTRIATARFYNSYVLAKKWAIVATIASPQSRDFKL